MSNERSSYHHAFHDKRTNLVKISLICCLSIQIYFVWFFFHFMYDSFRKEIIAVLNTYNIYEIMLNLIIIMKNINMNT